MNTKDGIENFAYGKDSSEENNIVKFEEKADKRKKSEESTYYNVTIKSSKDNKLINNVEENNKSVELTVFKSTLANTLTSESGTDYDADYDENENNHFVVKRKKPFSISYEFLVWAVFIFLTIIAMLDRFTLGGDWFLGRERKQLHKLWGLNFGEIVAKILWAISGRLLILAQNLMFCTTMWCIPNIICEYAPRWLRIDGIRGINIKIHRLCGIFLIGIPVVVHVLLIFVPPIADRTPFVVILPSDNNYSQQLGHLNWTKFWDPAAIESWDSINETGVHITTDEVYRLVLMIVLFCFLFPMSRSRCLNERSYSIAIGLHLFAGVWYSVDNIRKMSHELAHIFNLPVLIFWFIDRYVSIYFYRRSTAKFVSKEVIGHNEYVKLCVKLDKSFKRGIGHIYFLLSEKQKFSAERAHPFTTFSNHSEDNSWDVGFIISVTDDDLQWFRAWTRNVRVKELSHSIVNMRCWGPYQSSVSILYKHFKRNENLGYMLIASGSGFGYLLDALGVLAYKIERLNGYIVPEINMYYTVRNKAFCKSFHDEVLSLANIISVKQTARIKFHWVVTNQDNKEIEEGIDSRLVKYIKGRINFDKLLMKTPKTTTVYFVGRTSIANQMNELCQKYRLSYVQDFTNANRSGEGDRRVSIRYLKITFYITLFTLVVCLIAAFYVDVGEIRETLKAHV